MAEAAPIPQLLYGTAWKEERTESLTLLALENGFRGIDTANQRKHYFEAAVGRAVQSALRAGLASRSQLFLQTKFTFPSGQDHRLPYVADAPVATQVRQSLASSLEHFATDYVDSLLLHGPSSRVGLARADVEVWRTLEELVDEKRARFVGVSNFTRDQLQQLLELARIPPRFVQNRCYARTGWDREVRRLCQQHGVVYQGFSLLTANRAELETAEVRRIRERRGWSAAELVFGFARLVGMLPLTGTSSAEHMQKDLGALELLLEPTEVATLEALDGGR